MLDTLIQTVIFGLALGGVIAVSAVGLTLSYGVTRFINFSYGEFLTIGAFASLWLAAAGLPLPAAAAVAVVLTGLAAVLIARIVFEPLMERGFVALLVTSVGLAFVLQYAIRMVVGSNPVRYPVPLMRPLEIGGVFVPVEQALILAAALAVMLAVHLLLAFTLIGKKMRAVSDNPALARASGIDPGRILAATWFLSGLIAGLGGVLLAVTQITFQADMGFRFLLVVFAAVLLGGIGSPYGAMLGGLVVGVAMEIGTAYVAADYTYAFAFLILIVVLLARPAGLFGRTA